MMSTNRRKFLKLAGLGALGMTAGKYIKVSGKDLLPKLSDTETGKRLAMVIDLRKCLVKDGCTTCISSCNKAHNVPDFDNRKDEIKWITIMRAVLAPESLAARTKSSVFKLRILPRA